jgi:hypothetical protein
MTSASLLKAMRRISVIQGAVGSLPPTWLFTRKAACTITTAQQTNSSSSSDRRQGAYMTGYGHDYTAKQSAAPQYRDKVML